jgi:hypothetical protein
MGRHILIPSLGLCSVMLLGCTQAGRYDSASYRARYGAAMTGQPAVAATPGVPAPGVAPAAAGAGAPQAAEPAAGLATLPPLNLPVHEDWSSAQCPDLAVTFSGHSQPLRSSPTDNASFQEARQFRDRDYYEVAECFCTKYGNLSQTTKSAADAVTAQTAQQFSDTSHMRIRSATFVEDSPLGKYSELQVASQPPSAAAAALRTYWRGQCSMRVEAIWDPGTSARALQFLNSLHETGADEAGAAAFGAAPDASVPDAAAEKTDMDDLASQLKRRRVELRGAAAVVSPAAAEASSSAAAPGGALPADAALRLQQLKELQGSGLITKEEYETKRQAILKGL